MVFKSSFAAFLLLLPAFASSAKVPSLPPAPASCSVLPERLPVRNVTKLNDPFTFLDGRKVQNIEDFACRQAEVNALFQRIELGTLPPRPQHISSTFTNNNNLTINVSNEGKSISFSMLIQYPTTGEGPFPVVIGVGGASIPIPSNVALINFDNDDMAQQNSEASRGIGKFFDLYGVNATASSMTAWAWAISRIIDVLEMSSDHLNIDLDRIGVTGCSRDGKGALVAGAFDPRILLTIPQESGSGGAGCWRISDVMWNEGVDTQTLMEIVQENDWFSVEFENWVNHTTLLPFDHHMLAGLVSPRPLFVIDNTDYIWLGPESVWGCMSTAHKVYEALNIPDRMGVSQIGNHSHCDFPSDQQAQLSAFFDKFFFGDTKANTSIIQTDGANGANEFAESQWVDWSIPNLG